MKLSELKPCACCGKHLIKEGGLTWVVIKTSQAILHPKAAREVLGMTQYFNGALGLAEIMSPDPEAIKIIGDEGGEWNEAHVCMDCFMLKLGSLPWVMEK